MVLHPFFVVIYKTQRQCPNSYQNSKHFELNLAVFDFLFGDVHPMVFSKIR